jgi:hypothetical protein
VFFFAGGRMGAHSGKIRGGMVAAIYPLYLAAFFNGDLFSGEGSAADRDNPAYQGTADQTLAETAWSDDLALFLGNDFLGGLRFNLLFNAAEFVSQTEKDGGAYDYRSPFLTSLQWGRRFGGLSAGITVGVGWGSHESLVEKRELEPERPAEGKTETAATTVTTTLRDYSTAGIKLEAAYGSFAADYQLSAALGRRETVSWENDPAKNSAADIDIGSAEHLINLYYTATVPIDKGMTLSLRPRLLLGFYGNDHETLLESGGYESLRAFGFSPILDAEFGWRITEKVFVALSLSLSALTASFAGTGSGAYWEVEGLAVDSEESGGLDFRFAFSKSFVLEAGIGGLFGFGGARYALDLANLRGSFALVFKPGM